jgi:hypothetical protein
MNFEDILGGGWGGAPSQREYVIGDLVINDAGDICVMTPDGWQIPASSFQAFNLFENLQREIETVGNNPMKFSKIQPVEDMDKLI